MFFHGFKSFEVTAAPQNHIRQTGPQISQRRSNPITRLRGAEIMRTSSLPARGKEPVPVLCHPRVCLSQFEILTQPLACVDQRLGQKRRA